MISFEAARSLVIEHAHPLPATDVALEEAAGRFLAEDIIAPFDTPRFDNSAMDGYCVCVDDVKNASNVIPIRLRLAAVIRAGESAGSAPSIGEAVKIMTGAPVPTGTDAVVMREFCEEVSGSVIVRRAVQDGENIRRAGAEFRQGQLVFSSGTKLTPPVVGLLASFGLTRVRVHVLPRIAVISTGDELVEPGTELGNAQIYDGNSIALRTACGALGIHECPVCRVPDQPQAVIHELREAVRVADVVITIGGVSAGDYDFVREAIAAIGATMHFSRVAMKPGKPNVFATLSRTSGRNRDALIFGLPGNPVSALVSFHHYVRPALLTMMGARDVSPRLISALLGRPLQKRAGRFEFIRATLSFTEGRTIAYPTAGQDSHMLGGLAAACAFIHFPAETTRLNKDETVTVELLSW